MLSELKTKKKITKQLEVFYKKLLEIFSEWLQSTTCRRKFRDNEIAFKMKRKITEFMNLIVESGMIST